MEKIHFLGESKIYLVPPQEGTHWLNEQDYDFLPTKDDKYVLVVPKVKLVPKVKAEGDKMVVDEIVEEGGAIRVLNGHIVENRQFKR